MNDTETINFTVGCNSFRIESSKRQVHNCGSTGYSRDEHYQTLACNGCEWSRTSRSGGFANGEVMRLAQNHALGLEFTTDLEGNPLDPPREAPTSYALAPQQVQEGLTASQLADQWTKQGIS